MTARPSKQRLTMTIPEAARKLGVGRNQGYIAAHSGQIPTIKIGKRLLVPIAALETNYAMPAARIVRARPHEKGRPRVASGPIKDRLGH
jgi:excisionase family DNA binding protein